MIPTAAMDEAVLPERLMELSEMLSIEKPALSLALLTAARTITRLQFRTRYTDIGEVSGAYELTIATLTAQLAAAEKEASLAAEEAAAEVEQAHDEGYQEGVEEGRCEAQGAAADVFNFMYRWLKARDLLFDEGDGIDVNDVEEALRIYGGEAVIYERQRADRADQRAGAAEKRAEQGVAAGLEMAAKVAEDRVAGIYRSDSNYHKGALGEAEYMAGRIRALADQHKPSPAEEPMP